MVCDKNCVVPENIHTPPTEGIGNSGEEGGLEEPQISSNV